MPEKKTRKRLPPTDWAIIRILAESGQCTHKQLSSRFGVPISTIKQRSSDEKWRLTKEKTQAAINGRIEEDTVSMLARLGMPKERLMKMMINGAIKTEMFKNVKQAVKNDAGKIMTALGKPIVFEHTVTAPDNDNTREYREMLAKMAGWFAPLKLEIPQEIKNLSDEELASRLLGTIEDQPPSQPQL